MAKKKKAKGRKAPAPVLDRALPFGFSRGDRVVADAWGRTNHAHAGQQAAPARSLYFAFGSNMEWSQMKHRCPDAKFSGTGRIPGWALAFAGHSGWWGGAVATLEPSPKAQVEGVIYSVTDEDLARLDRFEGAPAVYAPKTVLVLDGMNYQTRCRVYVLRHAERTGPPGPKYLAQIQQSYMDFGFDLRRLYRAALAAAGK